MIRSATTPTLPKGNLPALFAASISLGTIAQVAAGDHPAVGFGTGNEGGHVVALALCRGKAAVFGRWLAAGWAGNLWPNNCSLCPPAMKRLLSATTIMLNWCRLASACPFCDQPTGRAVNAGIFNGDFAGNLVISVVLFFLLGLVAIREVQPGAASAGLGRAPG